MKILKKMKSKETNVTEDLAPLSLLEVFQRIKDGAKKSLDDTNEEMSRIKRKSKPTRSGTVRWEKTRRLNLILCVISSTKDAHISRE